MLIRNTKEYLLDAVFPKSCVGCGVKGHYLCPRCKEEIVLIKTTLCPNCGKISPSGKYCKTCRPNTDLTGVVVAAHYEEGPLKEAVHTFKYDFIFDLAEDLSTFLADAVERNNFTNKYLVTYVPLYKSRENWRGFNQSKLLAEKTAETLGLEIVDKVLKRVKQSKPQITLKRKERLENIKDTIQANAVLVDKVKGKRVIVVDDIITTGATLDECAKALRTIGTKEVWGLVLGKH